MNYILRFKKVLIISFMFLLFIIGLIVIYVNCNGFKNVYAASNNDVKEKEDTKQEEEVVKEEFFVDIKGEVVNPGVYLVNEDNIVNDVINMASGLTENANTKCINLSKKVSAEMVIYVYSNSETKKLLNTSNSSPTVCQNITNDAYININDSQISNSQTTTISGETNTTENKIVNINTADINTLTTLSGIGESKANDIIEYREANGGFKSIDEIKNVSGIGESTFEKIKSSITV